MNIFTIILLLTLSFDLFGQDKVIGLYRDYFGSSIQLNADKTFKYTWRGHNASSWTKGFWTLTGDTIHFHMIPIYDTASYVDYNIPRIDTIVLSINEIPERVELLEHLIKNISPNGQNRKEYPDKLLIKNGRLYKIQNGRLVKKKQKDIGSWSGEKYDPWYFKSDD